MDRRARRALGGRLQAGHRRLATCREPLGASRGLLLSVPHRFDGVCTAGIARLLGPKRNFLAGFVKSPNRWRWLAHVATLIF
jgi:hypothetical protein